MIKINTEITATEEVFFNEAVRIAKQAESKGNLPIGAIITLNDIIVSKGENNIYSINKSPINHAEIMAIKNIPKEMLNQIGEMTIYTTLEPCLMCFGAICLCSFKKIVFGTFDVYGGFSNTMKLPSFFEESLLRMQIKGLASPIISKELYIKSLQLIGLEKDKISALLEEHTKKISENLK